MNVKAILASATLFCMGSAVSAAEMNDRQLAEVRGQGFVIGIELPIIGSRDLVTVPTPRELALDTGVPQAYGELNQTYIATQPNRDAARAGRQAVADARNNFLATTLNAVIGLELPVSIRFE
ncbi:MAG TPA: hypothetical protein VNK45_00905 [Candidatus Acidoferrales bacterium]|nr:hypothetical protein [Candidatus Acidoferrales bacterium]